MWPFSKRHSLADSGILKGFTDCHCHLLPGVDDGVETIDETLQLLDIYETSGITAVWLTPHVMEDLPNTTAVLQARFARLQAAYHGPVTLCLSAEYMLDNLFRERLHDNDLLPLGASGRYLLVETSCYQPPIAFHDTIKHIIRQDHHPLLAHPERYLYLQASDYAVLKQTGVAFQINLPSLTGYYGKNVRKRAEWLIKKGWADCFGTDTHNLAMLQACISGKSRVTIQTDGKPCYNNKHTKYLEN